MGAADHVSPNNHMFKVTNVGQEGVLEGSLGGKVTAGEMLVFADECLSALESESGAPHVVVLNWSKAMPFDSEAQATLDEVRNAALQRGLLVVNIVRDENEVAWYSEYRWQSIQDGSEQYLLDDSIEELAYRENVARRAA